MTMRSEILGKIKQQLTNGDGKNNVGKKDPRVKIVADRLAAKSRGVTPSTPKLATQLRAKFAEEAEKADSIVVACGRARIAQEICSFLNKHELPLSVRMGSEPRLKELKKQLSPTVKVLHGPSDGNDLVCISQAEVGIAESGTLAVLSGPDNPTTNNFLPENHIVIVDKNDIVSHYEDLWVRIRKIYGVNKMPRTVNLITGPSRSGDIEQTLILGAHGPTRLLIFIV